MQHFTKTGTSPTEVYLGVSEYKELLAEMDRVGYYRNRPINTGRYKVYGLDIYLVDAETHLKVAR